MPEVRNLLPNPKPLDQGLSYKQVTSHENWEEWVRVRGETDALAWIMKCWQGFDFDTSSTAGYQNGVRLDTAGDYVLEAHVHTPARLRLQLVAVPVSDTGVKLSDPFNVISDTTGHRTLRIDFTTTEPCWLTWLLRAQTASGSHEWVLRRLMLASREDYEQMKSMNVDWFDGDKIVRGAASS